MPQESQLANEPIEDKELSPTDIQEILEDDTPDKLELDTDDTDDTDDKDEPKPKKASEETEDDEEIELSEEEDEIDIVAPPKRKDILKDFPDLFKKHPYLEKAYYRDQKFYENFASLDEAVEFKQRAQAIGEIEGQLLEGDTSQVLKLVKDSEPEAFKRLADTYLQTLAKVDENAYYHVVGNEIKKLIMGMAQEASTSKNEELNKAAVLIHQFVFGNSNFTPPQPLAKKTEDDGKDKLEEERLEFQKERFETARDDLSGKLENTLKHTVIDHIDPKGDMSSYVKRHAVQDAMDRLNTTLGEDDRFSSLIDKLWEQAVAAKYSPAAMRKIRSTFLARAKSVLPSVIKQARREALKDSRRTVAADEEEETPRSRRSPIKQPNDSKGLSTYDFFMQD